MICRQQWSFPVALRYRAETLPPAPIPALMTRLIDFSKPLLGAVGHSRTCFSTEASHAMSRPFPPARTTRPTVSLARTGSMSAQTTRPPPTGEFDGERATDTTAGSGYHRAGVVASARRPVQPQEPSWVPDRPEKYALHGVSPAPMKAPGDTGHICGRMPPVSCGRQLFVKMYP